VNLPGVSIGLEEGWEDVTTSLDVPNSPFTIARAENGVGALQLSIAQYKAGKLPEITVSDLQDLLSGFARNHKLSEGFDSTASEVPLVLVASSFHNGTDFVRAWYASDGRNVVFATYVCAWEHRSIELAACDKMILTIRFASNSSRRRLS
jgi:hypothetical protein